MMQFLGHARRMADLLEARKRLVVYHLDTDGTTSAALLLKFFPSASLALDSPELDADTLKAIEAKGPELIIFLDLAIEQDWKAVKRLEKTSRMLIIDHHLFERDLSSEKTLYINPRLERREAYLSASYLVYRLLKEMGKPVEGYTWISAIGVVGDYAFEEGRDVLEEVRSEDPTLLQGHPLRSRIGEAGRLISSAITAAGEGGGEKAVKRLLKAETFQEFEGEKELQKWKRRIDQEIGGIVEGFEKKGEFHPEKRLAVLETKSRYPVSSAVSTALAEKHPDLTIIIRRKDEEGFKLSLRNQSGKVNLDRLVKKACRGIGRGGGHEKAAGAWVTDWEKFRERFLKLL